jgi:hypothetical protein
MTAHEGYQVGGFVHVTVHLEELFTALGGRGSQQVETCCADGGAKVLLATRGFFSPLRSEALSALEVVWAAMRVRIAQSSEVCLYLPLRIEDCDAVECANLLKHTAFLRR